MQPNHPKHLGYLQRHILDWLAGSPGGGYYSASDRAVRRAVDRLAARGLVTLYSIGESTASGRPVLRARLAD